MKGSTRLMPEENSTRTIPLLPAIAATACGGALLLAISQFMALYSTRSATVSGALGSGSVGSDHSWALLPVAIVAAGLGVAVTVAASRAALLGVGALGLIAVIVGLSHDLSNARAHGLRPYGSHYIEVRNTVGGGLYVEIAGGLLLLVAAVAGFLLWGPPAVPSRGREPADAPSA